MPAIVTKKHDSYFACWLLSLSLELVQAMRCTLISVLICSILFIHAHLSKVRPGSVMTRFSLSEQHLLCDR